MGPQDQPSIQCSQGATCPELSHDTSGTTGSQ
jgi:hypothetical protein